MRYIEAIQEFSHHIVDSGAAEVYMEKLLSEQPDMYQIRMLSGRYDRPVCEIVNDLKSFIRIYGERSET